jgi:hypothetical protein
MSASTFNVAESDFRRFAVKEGYPPTFLWTTPDELVFWRGRFWVLVGNDAGRREILVRMKGLEPSRSFPH